MVDAMALAQERNQLFDDLFAGKTPKRVPVSAGLQLEFAIQYAGQDLVNVQWNNSNLGEIFDKVCQDFPSDLLPVGAFRFPSFYQLLGARNWVMGSQGFLQHPEIEGLEQSEYDEFIASPYKCIVEKVLPRLYGELDTDNSMQKAIAFAKGFKAFNDEMGNAGMIYGQLIQKYGYAYNTNFFAGFTEAPFDLMSDLLRGFKGISTDVRRIPNKVEAAIEAVYPLALKAGQPKMRPPHTGTFIPLHMAPYLRTKDFERFYWPTFKRLVDTLAEQGTHAYLFVEHDWMRYLDYLRELPENTVMRFEYGDPKLIKEKLGDKHIISGLYPISLLKTGTKEQCIDKAKELIDILAPGGRYFFDFDKVPITLDTLDVKNTQAVLEYVVSNAKY